MYTRPSSYSTTSAVECARDPTLIPPQAQFTMQATCSNSTTSAAQCARDSTLIPMGCFCKFLPNLKILFRFKWKESENSIPILRSFFFHHFFFLLLDIFSLRLTCVLVDPSVCPYIYLYLKTFLSFQSYKQSHKHSRVQSSKYDVGSSCFCVVSRLC